MLCDTPGARQETSMGAKEANRLIPTDLKRTARGVMAEQGGTAE